VENIANPIGQIFLRLLFMLVIPLVVSALILGVSELGDVRGLGKIGLKTFVYTVVISSIAVFIGLTLVNVLQPGKGLPEDLQAELLQQAAAVVVSHGEEPPESLPYAPVGNSSRE
jgi:DAACS family dicarboxylate/amino acid:cation (Na+ or H+) symporter